MTILTLRIIEYELIINTITNYSLGQIINLGQNWRPSCILTLFYFENANQNLFHHVCHHQKHIFRHKYCKSMINMAEIWKFPFFYFWHFFATDILIRARGRSSSQDFPVNIADSYSLSVVGSKKILLTMKNHGLWTKL